MDKQERGKLIRKRFAARTVQHTAEWYARTVATVESLPTLDEYPQADTSDILRTYRNTVEKEIE